MQASRKWDADEIQFALEFGHFILALKISHEMVVFTPNVTLSSLVIRTTVDLLEMLNCVIVCHGLIMTISTWGKQFSRDHLSTWDS